MIEKLDRQIILQLQEYGRDSNVSLAKSLSVSEPTVRKRIKKLVDKGVMKITAVPNLEKLGYNFTAFVALQTNLLELRAAATALAKYPNVCFLANITGRYDLLAIVAARSAGEFSDFIENVISHIPGITRTETFINLRVFKGEGINTHTQELIQEFDKRSLKK